LLLQFASCKNDSKIESNVNQYTRDTTIEYYEWGNEQIISLGIIIIDSVVYNVITIDRIIEVADGRRKRRFITFNTFDNTYKYEVDEDHFSFIGIKENKLIIGDHKCKEEITILNEDLLCFDCMDNACLLRVFEE
jgi:hypothetical protein